MINGAEAVVRGLIHQGVRVIYGYPGAANMAIYEALRRSREIEHVLTRSEQGAAHAASGYARVSGEPGVCLTTSGPGATNLVTGLATAYMDSVPLVAITGQVATEMVGTDSFQEVDITGITKPVTKHNYLVNRVEDIPRILAEAFHIAGTGRPGPVLIDIPKDIAAQNCAAKIPEVVDLPGYKPNYKGHPAQIRTACKLLNEAERPLIYAGGGIIHSGAVAELLKIAELLEAPVAVTLMGKGAFPEDHPLFLGMLGVHGAPAANKALLASDVILCIGARLDDRVTGRTDKFATQAKMIHIDIDPAEISKNIRVQVPIVGDAAGVMRDMLLRLQPAKRKDWLAMVAGWLPLQEQAYAAKADELNAQTVLTKLNSFTKGQAIITTDVGQHQMWAAQFCKVNRPQAFISSGGLGTMGYGLPAALGAQMAAPNDLVICVTGDGSLQMSMNEFATIKALGLPIKVLLFNNGVLGMVRQHQAVFFKEKYFSVDLVGNPDFKKIAEAYDMAYYLIAKIDQVDLVLQEALANGRATLVDCAIPKEQMVYPMVRPGSSLDDVIIAMKK